MLAELERDIGSRRIELSPLTRQELFEQLSDLLGEPPDAALVDRVFTRSEGHPLFVEELIAAGRDGRGALPSTLRDALMVRIERLSPAAQHVLRVIAVGQRLDDELLLDTTGLDRLELQEALREAVINFILAVTPEGRYLFRHALLREVVDDDLLPGERAAIDLRLAAALEARLERDDRACTCRPRSPTTTPRAAMRRRRCGRRSGPPMQPSGSTPMARRRICSSARSRCLTGCPTPRRWPGPAAPRSSGERLATTGWRAIRIARRRWPAPGSSSSTSASSRI